MKTSERLRFLALHMMASDCDMLLPSGCINPEDAADLLDEAERVLEETLEIASRNETGVYVQRAKSLLTRIRGE